MSDSVTPLVLFTTLKNTELGAEAISLNDDGSLSFKGVVKQVTESMLTSYPRTALGTWTPNRLALRYDRDQISRSRVRKFGSGEALDLDGILALAR